MSFSSSLPGPTVFRLREGAVECDAEGPRVGGIGLLERNRDAKARQRWRVPPLAEVESRLLRAFDRRIDATRKLGGLRVVAEALDDGELCRAQIAALHLQLPDPATPGAKSPDGEALGKTLHAYGWLLKDWDPDAHPRTGVPPNPGWFAPKDSESGSGNEPRGVEVASNDDAGTASDARPDYQVSQAEGGVDLPALTAGDPAVVRRKIADIAQSWVGSENWADAAFYNPVYRRHTNKCFVFVRDVLAQAGADPGAPNSFHGIARPPLAGQWGDPDFEIPGWSVLADGEKPMPGDVVAQKLGYSDASGHVMIVGDDDTFVGTGDPPNRAPGSIEQIPARDFLGPAEYRDDPRFRRGLLVYRRWVGQ